MNAVALRASAAGARLQAMAHFIGAALSHLSWGLAAITALLGLGRLATLWIGLLLVDCWRNDQLFRAVSVEIGAFCMLLGVLLAEQGVRSGARRLPSYVAAVVLAAICGGIVGDYARVVLCELAKVCAVADHPLSPEWRSMLFSAGDTLVRGGLAAFVYANREQMLRSMRELGAAQLERAEAENRLAQTQLQALQAQVEPDSLFDTLKGARRLYLSEPVEADRVLDALIQQLRAATQRVPL